MLILLSRYSSLTYTTMHREGPGGQFKLLYLGGFNAPGRDDGGSSGASPHRKYRG